PAVTGLPPCVCDCFTATTLISVLVLCSSYWAAPPEPAPMCSAVLVSTNCGPVLAPPSKLKVLVSGGGLAPVRLNEPAPPTVPPRSEEGRVGKVGRPRWSQVE